MNKTLSVLLMAASLIFTWDHTYANEPKEFTAESDDQSRKDRRSDKDNDDSKESRKEQAKGRIKQKIEERKERHIDRSQKRENEQRRDSVKEMKRNLENEKKNKEIQERRSKERDEDQNKRRDSVKEIKRNVENEKKNKEIQEKSKEREKDRNKRRDAERKESSDQKRDWESKKRDAVKNLPDRIRDKDKERKGDKRERISRERLKERENRWQSRSKAWRKNFSNHRRRDHIFDDHFWDRFRKRHHHWYFDNNFQWYSGSTWPRITVWLPWQWREPIYYYYETDGDVYYSNTEDFSYLTPVDSKEIFIAQAVRIANGRYPLSKEQSDWMPLGMFTFASEDDSSDNPKSYLSLAISKEGAVTGAYFDAENNTTHEIRGGIDPDSQRIAWKFVEQEWPIMESGLYNFTKEESTLLIHTSSYTTETQLLIKLDN